MNKFFSIFSLFFLISGIFVAVLSPVSASAEIVGDSWNSKASMSQTRYGLGVIAVDGKIYAIGGFGIGGSAGPNECYDPKTDAWTTLVSMPTSRGLFAVVEYQGKIYCLGGRLPPTGLYGSGGVGCGVNEVYDIATNSWSTKASFPASPNTGYTDACVVDGKFFVIDRGQYISNLYMYDPVADVWTTKTSMPEPLYMQPNVFVMVAIDDTLIVVDAQSTMIYDSKTDVWTKGASCPTIIYDGAVGVTSGIYAPQNVYVLGTGRPSGQSRSVMVTLVYDPVGDIWSFVEAMPTYRRGFGVAVVDDVLYVIGGQRTIEGTLISESLSVNEQYVPFGYTGTLPPVTDVPLIIASVSDESVSPDTSHSTSSPSSNSNTSTSQLTNANTGLPSTNTKEVTVDNNISNNILSAEPISDTSFNLGIIALIAGILTITVVVPATIVLTVVKKRNKYYFFYFWRQCIVKKLFSLVLIFLFVCGLFIAMFSPVLSVANSEDFWSSKASMLQARGGLGVIALSDKIYAIGGKTVQGTVQGFVGTNEQYDPKTDTWITLKSMPTARANFAIAAYDGKIYCIGGLNNGRACSVNEVYDVAADSWSTKTSLPVNGANLQGQVVDGKIFVIEGYNLFMYDPHTDLWAKRDSMPANSLVGSDFFASVVVDNTIIVTSKTKIMIYDPDVDMWREGATKPPSGLSSGVSGATAGVCASKKVYTIGTITTKEEWWRYGRPESGSEGQTAPGYVTSIAPIVMVYDPVKGTWSTVKASMNRVDFGIAVVDDILYVIGGYLIVLADITVTVDVSEFVPGAMVPIYQTVSKQFVAQELVVGAPCAFNIQYVPIGYSDSPTVTVVSPSNSIPSTKSELPSNILIIAGVALIVVIVITGVFMYSQKRNR
jgi:N-acetylneuraminic acid mutarotase